MVAMEKNVEKQLVVRAFEPDMQALKQTARQLSNMRDVTLNLYGQAGEVLIVITARAFAQAAATELTQSVAEQFELSLGNAVYGRGKGNLAHFAAGELIQGEAILAAADEQTGALLGEEFSRTKRGASVFDFGEESYHDPRKADRIRNEALKHADEEDPVQLAAARAAAAAKCCRADFGVSIVEQEEEALFVAVAHKKYVYLRQIPPAPDAQKRAALAALDIVRLLAGGKTAENARMFRANSDFDWNDPLEARRKNSNAGPILMLAVLLVALGVACWYFFTHFTLGDNGDSVQAGDSTSISEPASAPDNAPEPVPDSVPSGDGGVQTDTPPESGGNSGDAGTPAASSSGNSGTVRPFG